MVLLNGGNDESRVGRLPTFLCYLGHDSWDRLHLSMAGIAARGAIRSPNTFRVSLNVLGNYRLVLYLLVEGRLLGFLLPCNVQSTSVPLFLLTSYVGLGRLFYSVFCYALGATLNLVPLLATGLIRLKHFYIFKKS